MNMHKNIQLTPYHRQVLWLTYTQEKESVSSLALRLPSQQGNHLPTLKATHGRPLKP